MPSSNLDFNCAVVTGGAGGLGKAIAEYFLSLGKKVIIVGRTESKLKETAAALGDKTSYYVLDTGDIDAIPAFVKTVLKEHPEVDCLVNNAGVQRPLSIEKFDLASADQEININQRGPMHLAIGFLDHLKAKPNGGVIMNVSSVLGFIPTSIINPNYNATKAWVHFWTLAMRTQLKDTNVRIIEIVPPSVGTDLHRDREDPDDNKKHKNSVSLTVEEFMDEFRQNMESNKETFSAGPGVKIVADWQETYGAQYADAAKKYQASKKSN